MTPDEQKAAVEALRKAMSAGVSNAPAPAVPTVVPTTPEKAVPPSVVKTAPKVTSVAPPPPKESTAEIETRERRLKEIEGRVNAARAASGKPPLAAELTNMAAPSVAKPAPVTPAQANPAPAVAQPSKPTLPGTMTPEQEAAATAALRSAIAEPAAAKTNASAKTESPSTYKKVINFLHPPTHKTNAPAPPPPPTLRQ